MRGERVGAKVRQVTLLNLNSHKGGAIQSGGEPLPDEVQSLFSPPPLGGGGWPGRAGRGRHTNSEFGMRN
jgi:hypothetical protein